MTKRKAQYTANKAAKVCDTIICPICGAEFVKRQYSQAFCCSECKDEFWNAKGDRHRPGYYEDYDNKSLDRRMRRELFGSTSVVSVGGELQPSASAEIHENFLERKHEIEQKYYKEIKL